MLNSKKIMELFSNRSDEFKPYYEEENSLRRLGWLQVVAIFFIAPMFSLAAYTLDFPPVYYYLGFFYGIPMLMYIFICSYVKSLNKSLSYFFIGHLFLMTMVAFISLYTSNIDEKEFLFFFVFYTICVFIIQRWYPAVLYNIFVLILLTYAYQKVENPGFDPYIAFTLLSVLAICSVVVLYSRAKMIKSIEDYSDYLRKIMDNPGSGYVLFDSKKSGFKVLDFNSEAARELNVDSDDIKLIEKRFFSFFKDYDKDKVKRLRLGGKYVRIIQQENTDKRKYLEIHVIVLSLKNGMYWLGKINNVTQEINKREELEQNEKKYRNLYYRNKAGVFTIDKNSKIIDGNIAFFSMLDNVLGIGEDLFNSERLSDWKEVLNSLNQKESVQNYQSEILLPNKVKKTFIFSWYLDNQTNLIEGSVIDLTNTQKASEALKQSEEKYRSIYEESNDTILLLDEDKIVDINRRAIQLFGKSERQLLNSNLFDLSYDTSEENKVRYQNYLDQLRNKRSIKFEWLFDANTRKIEGEVSFIEIVLEDKLYYQCVINDQTDLNKNLRSIEQNRKNLENILENNPEGILIVNNDEILYRNPEINVILGEYFSLQELFTSEDQVRFNSKYEEHQKSRENQNVQLDLLRPNSEHQPVDVTLVSTSYEEKQATLIIIKDISVQNTLAKEKLRAEIAEETNKKLESEIKERIKAERLVQEQFLRTKAILDSSSNTFLLTLTLDRKISSFNTHFETYFHHVIGKTVKKGLLFEEFFNTAFSKSRLRYFRILFYQITTGKSHQFEVKISDEDIEVWLEIFMNPIFDTEGKVAEISIVAHDISEKKKSSNEIVESLKEKEVLLKEIHHRVKNNLQIISSILNLQSSFVTDENTLEILQESRNRIRSMAIIHENLYRTEDFSSINFADYLQNLASNLVSSYRIQGVVKLDAELDEINLVLDQAIPCGLFVNELITNSLKYAWPEGGVGTIKMRLSEENGQVNLLVGDNGVGLPDDFDEMNSDTLGLQLVVTLVEQLDGELIVNSEKGTEYLIKFENIKTLSDGKN